MTQPALPSFPNANTPAGSATRHGAVVFVITQLLARTAVHYGFPLPGDVIEGSAEVLIDLASTGAALVGAGIGALWRQITNRSAAAPR